MNIETLNPYVIKILIAMRPEDSINAISQRIRLSYGWTHKWIKELVKEGIVKEKWRGLILQENNKKYKEILYFIRKAVGEIDFYYSVLPLFGIDYCFTKTDAVYLWTEGRYNIARYREFYPIFIKIKKKDYSLFEWYCRKLSLKINAKDKVFYSVEKSDKFNKVIRGDYKVEPLNETIAFMKSNIYNFQPALEMISELYNKKLNIKYREVN